MEAKALARVKNCAHCPVFGLVREAAILRVARVDAGHCIAVSPSNTEVPSRWLRAPPAEIAGASAAVLAKLFAIALPAPHVAPGNAAQHLQVPVLDLLHDLSRSAEDDGVVRDLLALRDEGVA
jgi:hypothetical protein